MLSFLASLGIGTIVSRLAAAYEARQKATTDQERIKADVRIQQLEGIAKVQAAEGGSRLNAIMRAAIAVGPAAYLLKIFLIDKVLGWGRTDDLSPELWSVVTAVIGFYFLYEGAVTLARIAKR